VNVARLARSVSTAAVTMIAAWSSWSHMVHVALRFGERPEVAYVLPISVDGMLVVASTAMVEDKRAGRDVRWSARLAFGAGVAASVAANIAAARPTVGARIVAAWPALAMLLVVEILSRSRPPERPAAAVSTMQDAPQPVDSLPRPTSGVDDPTDQRTEQRGARTSRHATSRRRADEPGRPRRTAAQTGEAVHRLRTVRPDATPADIATEIGVSERHVRRLLATEPEPRADHAGTLVPDIPIIADTNG
jgi:hypothetical protein